MSVGCLHCGGTGVLLVGDGGHICPTCEGTGWVARREKLEHQITVRVPDELHARLAADAQANGRTVAQSVRHLLTRWYDQENGR